MKKTLTLAIAAGAASLAIPAIASAHNAAAVPYCDRVEVSGTDFRNWSSDRNVISVRVTADGAPVALAAVTPTRSPRISFATSSLAPTPIAYVTPLTGSPTVRVYLAIDAPDFRRPEYLAATAVVDCPVPPPPPAPPVQPPVAPPAVVTPPPVPPVVEPHPPKVRTVPRSCADLRRAKAGHKWLVKLGCVKPRPKRITCAYLDRVKAGPREYTKRGWYFRCEAPPETGRRSNPPVAG